MPSPPADGRTTDPDPAGVPSPLPGAAAVAAAARRRKPTVGAAVWRFGAVGLAGTGVNLAVLWLLHGIGGLGFTRSSAIATELAIISNYVGNELWTFHLRRLSLRRLAQFNLAALAGLIATVVVATIVKEVTHPLLAQLVGIGAGASLNFAINFGWTWRADPDPTRSGPTDGGKPDRPRAPKGT